MPLWARFSPLSRVQSLLFPESAFKENGWGEGRAQAHVHEQRLVIKPRASVEVRQHSGCSDTLINIL